MFSVSASARRTAAKTMEIVHSLDEVRRNKDSVITIGTFDGVHLAHQKIIGEVRQRAKERNGRSVVVTFNPHPKEIVSRKKQKNGGDEAHPVELLTTHEEKLELLSRLDIDLAFVVPFTYEFSRKPFREFYIEYIINGIGVSEVIEGYDHGFGRDREAGLSELLALGREFKFSVVAEKPFTAEEEVVSSSRIRSFLSEGAIAKANRLLGRRFSFSGKVISGDKRGKALGYPTANIEVSDPRKILPRNGVYAVTAAVDGASHRGLMSIGVVPTFYENHPRLCEVHIFDFDKDIYGKNITVECCEWIREEKKFTSADELVKEMDKDTIAGKTIFENIQL
jgi:riboflavin kinase/FMN adenylyltransferase